MKNLMIVNAGGFIASNKVAEAIRNCPKQVQEKGEDEIMVMTHTTPSKSDNKNDVSEEIKSMLYYGK